MPPLRRYRSIIIALIVIASVVVAYWFTQVPSFPLWMGFQGKTLWDVLELAIIPISLALVSYIFNRMQSQNEQSIARDREAEAALQNYLDKMTDLLLENRLLWSNTSDEERSIARSRTMTILQTLDGKRKGYLVRFLYESHLLEIDNPIVRLHGANLRGIDLSELRLPGINLRGVDLREANLAGTNLEYSDISSAKLNKATLSAANLRNTNLWLADLSQTNLRSSTLEQANLQQAKLEKSNLQFANLKQSDLEAANLSGANLETATMQQVRYNEATVWPDGFVPPDVAD